MSDRTICVAGKNRIAVSALEVLGHHGMPAVVCPVSGDDGLDSWQPSLVRKAKDFDLPIVELQDLYSNPELLLLSLEYDRILDPSRFASADLFNIHFSLLPKYRGCLTSIWPILLGEEQSGVTLHRIDHGIDSGPILAQRPIPLFPSTTARDLYERYQDEAVHVLDEVLPSLVTREYIELPQDNSEASYFSRSSFKNIDFEIDFSTKANQIVNFVRGLYFPEYQTALFKGRRVLHAALLSEKSRLSPGTVLSHAHNIVRLETLDFQVELLIDERDSGSPVRSLTAA